MPSLDCTLLRSRGGGGGGGGHFPEGTSARHQTSSIQGAFFWRKKTFYTNQNIYLFIHGATRQEGAIEEAKTNSEVNGFCKACSEPDRGM